MPWDPAGDLMSLHERMERLARDGVLTITVPKAAPPEAKRIPVE